MLEVLEQLKTRESKNLKWDWNEVFQICSLEQIRRFFTEEPDLLEEKDSKGSTPLLSSIVWFRPHSEYSQLYSFDHFSIASLLVSLGADVNATHKIKAESPWDDSAHTPFMAIQMDSRPGALLILLMMLRGGADLEKAGRNGATALHFAARNGNTTAIDLLVGAGANINVINDYGETPLHSAVYFGEVEAVVHLLRLGANAGAKDIFGGTPLAAAIRRKTDPRNIFEKASDGKPKKSSGKFPSGLPPSRLSNENFDKLVEIFEKKMRLGLPENPQTKNKKE